MSNPENPSAFPVATIDGYVADGMTLRDYFAAHAPLPMPVLTDDEAHTHAMRARVKAAYHYADLMLAERSKH